VKAAGQDGSSRTRQSVLPGARSIIYRFRCIDGSDVDASCLPRFCQLPNALPPWFSFAVIHRESSRSPPWHARVLLCRLCCYAALLRRDCVGDATS
jgi:hypothetical protein